MAQTIDAYKRCIETKNAEWERNHRDALEKLVKNHLPSGSGFDNGTKIDYSESTGEKVILITNFHHMDNSGGYTDWTSHQIKITPSLMFDFDIKISGKDKNGIKEYINDVFNSALAEEIEY